LIWQWVICFAWILPTRRRSSKRSLSNGVNKVTLQLSPCQMHYLVFNRRSLRFSLSPEPFSDSCSSSPSISCRIQLCIPSMIMDLYMRTSCSSPGWQLKYNCLQCHLLLPRHWRDIGESCEHDIAFDVVFTMPQAFVLFDLGNCGLCLLG
jgi:hypothetical protein